MVLVGDEAFPFVIERGQGLVRCLVKIAILGLAFAHDVHVGQHDVKAFQRSCMFLAAGRCFVYGAMGTIKSTDTHKTLISPLAQFLMGVTRPDEVPADMSP